MAGRYGPFQGRYRPFQMQSGLRPQLSNPTSDPGTTPPPQTPSAPAMPSAMTAAPAPAPGPGGVGGFFEAPPTPGGAVTPGALAMAGGGVIPVPSQGGTVTPDLSSALASVQSALAMGRSQFGLPDQLIGGNTATDTDMDPNPSGEEESETHDQGSPETGYVPGYGAEDGSVPKKLRAPNSYADGGVIPGAANPDAGLLMVSQAQREAMQRAALAAKEGQGKDVIKVPGYAAGGPVTGGDMSDPSAGGIPPQPTDNMPQPQQGQTQAENMPNQQLAAYAMGAGAVTPDIAAALEQQVDPQGTMDPAQRKMLAVASAGDPKNQFAVMQHYRQRFNLMNAYARAAAEGTAQRGADLGVSTQAAIRAYHNVPNGHSISFMPAGNHVVVSMNNYAGGSKAKGYADGGPVTDDVTDDDVPVPTGDDLGPVPGAVNSAMEGVGNAITSGAEGVAQDFSDMGSSLKQGLSQVGPGLNAAEEKARQFVLSIPQYLQFLKNGQFDRMMDAPTDSSFWETPTGDQQQGNVPTPPTVATQEPTPPVGAQEDVQRANSAGAVPSAAYPPRETMPAGVYGNADQAPGTGKSMKMTLMGGPHAPSPDQAGFDPRLVAQATAMFPQGSNAWKEFIMRGQQGISGQQAELAKERTRGQYQLRTWGARENAINGRSAARDAMNLERTQLQVAQRALASANGNIGLAARSVMNTNPGMQFPDALKIVRQAMQQGVQPQPQQNAPQQNAPAQAPVRGQPIPPGGQSALIAGTIYQTPRGPLKWTGTGFIQP